METLRWGCRHIRSSTLGPFVCTTFRVVLVSRIPCFGAWRGGMWALTGIRCEFTHRPVIRRTPSAAERRAHLTLFPHPPPRASQDHQTTVSAALSCPRIMSEDHASKQRRASRSAITNTAPAKQLVRPRPGSPSGETQDDSRPAKRTRKAINCEPCRNSKLKCDRSVRIRQCGSFLILLLQAPTVFFLCPPW